MPAGKPAGGGKGIAFGPPGGGNGRPPGGGKGRGIPFGRVGGMPPRPNGGGGKACRPPGFWLSIGFAAD